MANDSGLANDTCIFIEAIKGDRGVHNGNKVWWLSPDITVGGTSTPSGFVESGPVRVKIHRKPASSNCQFLGDENLTVELWAAPPSLVVAPGVRDSAQMVQTIGTPMPVEGGSVIQPIDLTSSDPAQPLPSGPKTLVARCYSSSASPSASNFFLPGDQHVALRNLFVVATSSTQVAFRFRTISLVPQLTPVKKVKLKAVLDLSHDTLVKNAVVATGQSIPGLTRLRTEPLVGPFRFDLTGFPTSNVVDPSTPPPVISPFPTNPFFEAEVELPRGR